MEKSSVKWGVILKNIFIQPTNLYEEAERRYEELVTRRNELERHQEQFPQGKLRVVKRNNGHQYFLRRKSEDYNGEYVPQKDVKTIRTFLQKKYETKLLDLLNSEIKGLEKLLEGKEYPNKIRELFSSNPKDICAFLSPSDLSDEDYANWWINQEYTGKTISADCPTFITDKGERVRSKSELIIANTLYKLKVPYKYECPLQIRKGLLIFPDFTVLDVIKRREIFWEHRGMMDDADYSNHSVVRIKEYENAGIFLGEKLIITEETSCVPLNTPDIAKTIKHYILHET